MKIEEAPSVVKQEWSVLSGLLKSKSSSVKGKAAHVMKSKVAVLGHIKNKKIFGLIKSKKIFGAISGKMNSLFGHEEKQRQYSSDNNMALMAYHASQPDDERFCEVLQQCEPGLECLVNALLESDLPTDNPRNSVSVIVEGQRMSTCSEGQRMSTCSVEDEIDILAEDFIRRFRSQMVLQQQNSFQRYQEMLDRGVS